MAVCPRSIKVLLRMAVRPRLIKVCTKDGDASALDQNISLY